MYEAIPGPLFNIACGWKWAIRIVPSSYNCEMFSYSMKYIDPGSGSNNCGSTCTIISLTPGTEYCINAKQDEDIIIKAVANVCCLPAGYERNYTFTPTRTASSIGHPNTTYGQCMAYRCPLSGSCSEDQVALNSAGPITLSCFTGKQDPQQRDKSDKGNNVNIEQDIIIYNIQGIEVFRGKWKFGDITNYQLNWPIRIGQGLYLVKFQNSESIFKLFKLN
jgi:hypothetical protein